MDIKPIRTEDDYQRALARVSGLMSARTGTDEGDELDVLAALIERYEQTHYPIDAPDPISAIRFRMEQMGLEPKDLEPLLGSSGRVSEILNRRRGLSLTMIRKLNEAFQIPSDVLIREYELVGW